MKKTMIAVALLGAVCAASVNAAALTPGEIQQQVTVTFTGTVQDAGCEITVDTVKLGNVLPLVNQKAGRVPVSFKFTKCKTAVQLNGVQKIELIQDVFGGSASHPSLATGQLKAKVNGAEDTNVYVKLYNTAIEGDDTFEMSRTVTAENLAAGGWVATPYYAQLETGGTAPTQSGNVEAKAMFQVSYK